MNRIKNTVTLIAAIAVATLAACTTEPISNSNNMTPGSPSPAASSSPSISVNQATAVPVTLPVLDALFSDEAFKAKLKSNVQLTEDQLAQLQKIAGDEVARLRQSNSEEQSSEQSQQAEQARERATEAIRGVIGEQKAADLFAIAWDYWVQGSELGRRKD